ncbi:MAG: TniQ family protein, partial [Candidatus Thiodiazotropha sp.]
GLNDIYMHHLATGKVDIEQLATFTEHTPDEIERAALKLGPPSPGGRYDEYVTMHRWRYCPVCIQQGKSHQKAWLLPFVTACPEHKCELVDSCYKCGRPHAVNLPLVPYCGGCQLFSDVDLAHPHELECSQVLIKHMNDETKLKAILDRLMTAWYLSTSEALRPHYRFSPQLRTVDEMRKRVIQLWPAASQPEHLSDAIASQIENLRYRWPHLPFVSTMLVNRTLEAGATLPGQNFPGKRIQLLRDDDPWWVPQTVAAKAAGISDHIIQRLVDKKQVRSRLFSNISGDGKRHKFRMVDLNNWHTLIEELYSNAIQIEDKTGLSNILMFRLHEVVRDVRAGKMSIFAAEGDALPDLMVCFNESRTSARRRYKPSDTMISAEAVELLGTYHAVVADLVKRGILKALRKPNNHRILIDVESVNNFHKEYILVGTLAKQYGVNNTNLAEKLASLGIMPAPFEALVSIYRRIDIKGIDLETVKSLTSYATMTGRKSTVDPSKANNPRVKKLIELVAQHGGQSNFCRKFGGSPGTLSLILREKKAFGPLAAKRMEERCGLELGQLNSATDK